MSLNPVQFGKDVIDQFGRYLMTSFPVADDRLAAQMREKLRHTVGSESLLYKGPYVHLNQPFKMGPLLDDLIKGGQVHRALNSVFPYPGLHWHQGAALDASRPDPRAVSAPAGRLPLQAIVLAKAGRALRRA